MVKLTVCSCPLTLQLRDDLGDLTNCPLLVCNEQLLPQQPLKGNESHVSLRMTCNDTGGPLKGNTTQFTYQSRGEYYCKMGTKLYKSF